jgi:L-lactate dehydrogenase complex protein LldG
MGGKLANPPANGSIDTLIRKLFPDAKVICSATPEVKGNRSLEKIQSPGELNDVDVGVVRAVFGVAENGVVWLSEEQFKVNSLGFLAQHLVVLIDPDAIVTNMHRAYQRADFGKAKYAVFMTGPSATADIEGVLIHGAQGIRTMTVIPLSAP